jgi:hypothetical protein
MPNQSPFVFATSKNGKKDELKAKETRHKSKGILGDIAGIPKGIRKMKNQQAYNKQKNEEEKLKQARRDYEIAAAKTGVHEEVNKAKELTLQAKERELQARTKEHVLKQQETNLKKQKEEDFWAIKKRIQAVKPETVV